MTPYQTPHTSQTPRYGQTSSNGPFLHPGAPISSQRSGSYRESPYSHHMPSPHNPSPNIRGYSSAAQEEVDWDRASDSWANKVGKTRDPHSSGSGTPRDMGRITPRRYVY